MLKFLSPLIYWFIKKSVTVSRKIDDKRRYRSAEKYFTAYLQLYNIPTIFFKTKVEIKERLLGKKINPYFVILCIYNEKREILILKEKEYSEWRLDIDKSKLEFKEKGSVSALPGNYLEQHENILECVNRVAKNRTGMNVDMVHPLCFAENTFFNEDEKIIQKGIVFLAQARKEFNIKRNTAFEWIGNEDQIPEEMYLGNKEILKLALEKVKERCFMPIMEIDSQKVAEFRHWLHEKTISKLFFLFSSRKIREKISEILKDEMIITKSPISILDTSCGYDQFLIELALSYPNTLVIGNDISWQSLSQLAFHDPEEKIILTNHDINHLPFNCEFNVIICKNTLHHLTSSQVENLITRLINMGRMIIIVEIEDPKRSSIAAKLWNYYYVFILKDCGTNFYTFEEFKSFVKSKLNDSRMVSFDLLSTVKGRYMFAIIKRK